MGLGGVPWEQLREGAVISTELQGRLYGALCKLKDYENTGLSPGDVERFVDWNKVSPVGGVDRGAKMDRISLQNAVETPFWMAVWAAEPDRRICVEMSYSDLKIIADLIDAARGNRNPVN